METAEGCDFCRRKSGQYTQTQFVKEAYTYDPSDNVSPGVSFNVNGTNVNCAWDADNRLQSVTDNRTAGVTT